MCEDCIVENFEIVITKVHIQIPGLVQGTLAPLLKGHKSRDEAYMMADKWGFEGVLHVGRLHL